MALLRDQSLFRLAAFAGRHLRTHLEHSPTIRAFAAEAGSQNAPEGQSGWLSGWVKSKIPAALGGNREEVNALENLGLDDYAESLKQARRMGGLTGFASGTSSAADPAAQGTLRLFENIIGAMLPDEKRNLTIFGPAERNRVASEVGCTTSQVDDCIARYLWMRNMTSKMAQLKKEGKPMPTSIDEVESMLGTWRQYKTDSGSGAAPGAGVAAGGPASSGGGSGNFVSLDAKGPKGQPCPLAGINVGKNTKCPLTKKAYKSCCGKGR